MTPAPCPPTIPLHLITTERAASIHVFLGSSDDAVSSHRIAGEVAHAVRGQLGGGENVLTRIHSSCLTGDIFHSARCDCGPQLELAMKRIADEGRGVVLYLNQEGRGIGLANKIRAYALQDEGFDTVEANERLGLPVDSRDYRVGVEILRDLGVKSTRLLSNNPRKLSGANAGGLSVSERIPIEVPPSASNERYLRTKKERLGHQLSLV